MLKSKRFALRVESLENRWVPSCTAEVIDLDTNDLDDVHDYALVVTCDNDDDVVEITDNGAENGITVIAGVDITPDLTGLDINHIIVDTEGGEDHITYSRSDDDGSADRNVVLDAGKQNDIIHVDIGDIGADSVVSVDASGGMNDDQLNLYVGSSEDSANIAGSLSVTLDGGKGNDRITVYSDADVAEAGTLALGLYGGQGDDVFCVHTHGIVDGLYDFVLEGGMGDDVAAIEIDLGGGSGTFSANVELAKGNDDLIFELTGDENATVDAGSSIDGGPGAYVDNYDVSDNLEAFVTGFEGTEPDTSACEEV